MMKGQASMGPFGPMTASTTNDQAQADQNAPFAVIPVQAKVSEEQAKLENMSLANLKKVAKKLSISGFEKMEKKELIEAILRVTNSDE